jgi:hypothetical protein
MGILTCTGVRYAYSIKSQQFVPIVTSYTLPPQGNGFYNFIDGEITLKIIWETYTDPPELGTTTGIDVNLDPGEVPPTVSEGITPDTITPIDVTGDSPIPQTVEEWRELQVILKDGFNLRYRDKTDMDTISHREIQAENDIINSCIPDREHALRIAKKAIWDSMKNISYSPSIPPIFSFYPFLLINIYISFYYLTPKTTKILGISFNNSKDNVSFIVDTKCSTRVGLI